MGLLYRLSLVPAYLSRSRDFSFPISELFRRITSRSCVSTAQSFIDNIEQRGPFVLIKLRNIDRPLFWPSSLSHYDFHRVITECFCETDWHFYEVPETRVRPEDVVLDCGAAEGLFTLRVYSRAKHVFAFEPSRLFLDSLAHTFNGVENVSIMSYALGSKEGESVLSGTALSAHLGGAVGGEKVRITTIDAWAERTKLPVNFIKADIESFEFEMLKGAAKTISTHSPRIALTVYHPGNRWREILGYCQNLVPTYRYKIKGLSMLEKGYTRPVMIHLWNASAAVKG